MTNYKSIIIKILHIFELFGRGLIYYAKLAWLPLCLAVLFIIQNYLFNFWLDIFPNRYFIERTLATMALGLLIFGPSIFFGKRIKYVYLIGATLITSTIFILQFFYYSYSGGFLQSSALLYAGEGLKVLGTVRALLSYQLMLFVIGPLLTLATCIFYKRNNSEKFPSFREKSVLAIAMAILIIFDYGYLIAQEYAKSGDVAELFGHNESYDINALVSKISVSNYSLVDLSYFIFHTDLASAKDLSFVTSWINQQKPVAVKGEDFGIAKGRNLIFIQVESLENSVINEKISGQEITPNLNQLAKDGLYFSNYYAQIGPGNTADTEFSTLNSLYPLPDVVAFIQYAYDHYTALPSLLEKNGYHTFVMHGDVPSFWNRANIYPGLGYEEWISRKDYTIPRSIGFADLGDNDFFNQSIPKLQTLPQPFMATLITLSSHTPFQLPSDLENLPLPENNNLTWLQQHYLESIHYTDFAIGNFIEQFKKDGLYDNSLIVIFGDHGSFTKIGDALGITGKTPLPEMENSQAPLIILTPKTNLQGINNSPSSHLDLYPTVANLLGINVPPDLMGQDILNTKTPIFVYRNLVSGTINSFITSNLAYVSASDGVYVHGSCLKLPDKTPLPLATCKALFDEEENKIKISDLMVENNLIPSVDVKPTNQNSENINAATKK